MPRLLVSAVCALAAHAVVYGSVSPGDGAHGYFGWYQPLALAAFVALIGLRRFVPWRAVSIAESTRALAVSGLAFLLVQESLERSFATGHAAFAAFTPTQWLLLLVAVTAAALVLSFALRAVFGRAPSARGSAAAPAAAGWSLRPHGRRRSRPLAERFALRAPPRLTSSL
jgi:hypothetical protein